MRKNTKIPVAIGIIAAILLFAASFNLYYLRDDSGGQLLWNADEAYLFSGTPRSSVELLGVPDGPQGVAQCTRFSY